MVFTGRAKMPDFCNDENEMVAKLKSDSSLVGYISKDKVVEGLKVLNVK